MLKITIFSKLNKYNSYVILIANILDNLINT
jgi:hypothetical protein